MKNGACWCRPVNPDLFKGVLNNNKSGSSSFGRASAFQAEGGRFEPGLPLFFKLNALIKLL